MSTVLGGNGLKEVYMKFSSFGAVQISAVPKADNADVLQVTIGCEHRIETLNMETNKDETVDQFCQRVKSMLRSLWNAEPREKLVTGKAEVTAKAKTQTWDEQKAGLKAAAAAAIPAEGKKG